MNRGRRSAGATAVVSGCFASYVFVIVFTAAAVALDAIGASAMAYTAMAIAVAIAVGVAGVAVGVIGVVAVAFLVLTLALDSKDGAALRAVRADFVRRAWESEPGGLGGFFFGFFFGTVLGTVASAVVVGVGAVTLAEAVSVGKVIHGAGRLSHGFPALRSMMPWRAAGNDAASTGMAARAGWRAMQIVARLMPPAAGRRWLGEAESFLFEAPPRLRRDALASYVAGIPKVITLSWAAVLTRHRRPAGRGPASR